MYKRPRFNLAVDLGVSVEPYDKHAGHSRSHHGWIRWVHH